ncbi:MAG: hypothetical protein ABI047_03300 [Jatrophihabitantaceae bacterium]
MSYAEGTTVSIERSQMEIATMIRKYGAQSFGTGWNAGHALVTFKTGRSGLCCRSRRTGATSL